MDKPKDLAALEDHFSGRSPAVREVYDTLLRVVQRFGPVREEAKKTSIHLARTTAFAGVQTRREWLVLTLKASDDIDSPRVTRRERVSANRWHLEIKLSHQEEVDAELVGWLEQAYFLAR